MRELYLILGFLTLLSISTRGQQVYLMDFENVTNGVEYTTSMPECNEGPTYFGVHQNGDLTVSFPGNDGKYFAAHNTGIAPCSSDDNIETLLITGIDISGVTELLQISIDAAEHLNSNKWDAEASVHIDYQIDDGGFKNGIWIESVDATGDNGFAAHDLNYDGVGDVDSLIGEFTTLSQSLPESGNSMDIRITFNALDEANEDIALDNITVSEVELEPLPKNLPYLLDFEDETNNLDYFTSIKECYGGESVFGVFEEAIDSAGFSSNSGLFFLAHHITELPCSSTDGTETVTIPGIDISAASEFLKLQIDLAESGAEGGSWDAETFLHVDYQVDGNGYQNGLWLEANGSNIPAVDTDYNGIGNSTEVESSFSTFTQFLELSGDSIDLRLTFNGFDEEARELALDNIRLAEVSEITKQVPYLVDFDNDLNGLHYSTSMEECDNGEGNYFGVITDSTMGEGHFFGAREFGEGTCGSTDDVETLFISDIDISSVTDNLDLSADLGRLSSLIWHIDDFVHIDYRIDGGAYKEGIWIESSGITGAGAPGEDEDFDRNADGKSVPADSLATFSTLIPENGSTLDLRITMSLKDSWNDILLDNLKLVETTSTPLTNDTAVEIPYLMDFEDATNGVDYITSMDECIENPSISANQVYFGVFTDSQFENNFQESDGNLFGVQDTDGEGCGSSDNHETVTFTDIDISEATRSLQLSVHAAEGIVRQNWDDSSYIHIDYSIDGEEYKPAIWFEHERETSGNHVSEDTDFDGHGDGVRVGFRFSQYSRILDESGESMDIRITFNGLDTRGKDFAIDNIELIEEPETSFLSIESGGWRLLSSPISGTYADLLDTLWTQGIPSGADVTSGAPNVLTFDTESDTFEGLADLNETMIPGQGFAVYVYADDDFDGVADQFPKRISVSGKKNSGDVSPVLNDGTEGDEAFTLVGNPYDRYIDWDYITRNDLSEVVYVYDPSIPGYVTWNGSTGGLTDGRIDPYTGFWVENISTENPLLLIQERDAPPQKTVSSGQEQYSFSMNAEMNDLNSSTYFSFTGQASVERDNYDGLKLTPMDFKPYVSLASRIGEGLYDINNLPVDFENEITIPLKFSSYATRDNGWVEQSGEVTFSWNEMESLPANWSLFLHDTQTGITINMREQTAYSFTVEGSRTKTRPSASLLKPVPASVEKTAAGANRFTLSIRRSVSTISNEPDEAPATFELSQNYPNPFNPATVINYQLPVNSLVSLKVYDMLGREVATLVDEKKSAGSYNVSWNAANLASGIYIYRLQAGANVFTRKMTLIK